MNQKQIRNVWRKKEDNNIGFMNGLKMAFIGIALVFAGRLTGQSRVPVLSFSCRDTSGNEINIQDFQGKVVYLDVWATWCLPCRMQFPKMQELKEEYHGKDVVFLYVSVDLDEERWVRFLRRKSPSGIHLIANDFFQNEFCAEYGIYAIPRFMLIDKKGNLFSADANRPGWEEVRTDINLLIAE